MSQAQKILAFLFAGLTLAALVIALYGLAFPERLMMAISPDSVFQWENFHPLSREPGLFGISPLIWTMLFVLPVAILLPVLIYLTEKKKVPGVARVALATMRAGVLIVLFLLLAGPSLVDSERYSEGSKLAVLVDDSLSMGEEAREFPVFNVFDDRESESVRSLRRHLGGLGIDVPQPPAHGFVTLTEEELQLRNFIRDVVRARSTRLRGRLAEIHGGEFDIVGWQRLRAEITEIMIQADIKQSELSAENARDNPDAGRVRRLQSELAAMMSELQRKEERFAAMLGGEARDEAVKRKRALIENLLETCHEEGPRRWDIACELLVEGNTLSNVPGQDIGLLDLVRRRAAEITTRGDPRFADRQMPMIRYFVFSTRFGRPQVTDEAIMEVTLDDFDFMAPRGRLTEIDAALREIRRYFTQEDDLAAILVLTDGRDTSPRRDEMEEIVARGRQDYEVVTVGIGNPKPVRVLELLSVTADREVLKGDYLDFKLKIRADRAYRANPETGEPGISVKIILCEDSPNNPIGYQEINGMPVRSEADMFVALGAEELTEVRVRFQPQSVGKRVYYLKVNEDRLPDEDTYRNNVKTHEVEVIDRRIKVLYLEQSFRYQARYLNEALKRDDKIEYQGFFFDAMDGWRQPVSNALVGELPSLQAPFFDGNRIVRNKEDFFNLDYDVIIIGDIDPSAASSTPFRREYWDWLEEWVSQHRGGLILLAGQSHNPHDYYNIEKARALYPIEIEPSRTARDRVDRRVMKYWRLTPAGRAHELHGLSSNAQRNDELWGAVRDGVYHRGQLNGLYWHAVTAGIKPAPAVALSRVAREGPVSGEGDVLTAVAPYGNGMTVYIGSDDTWLWREFFGDHYFYRFWQNVTRFSAGRRLRGAQQRVDVYTDRTEYQVGDDIRVYVELLGDIYDEVAQGQLNELRELPDGGSDAEVRRLLVDIQARAGGRLSARRLVLTEVPWSPNMFEGILEAGEPGQFDVWVHGYEESRQSPHRYSVIAPVAELRDLSMDLDGLRRRATRLPPGVPPLEYQQGRRMYLMDDLGLASLDVREREHEITGTPSLLWDRSDEPWGLRSLLLVVLLVLLAGEWLTRKFARMV